MRDLTAGRRAVPRGPSQLFLDAGATPVRFDDLPLHPVTVHFPIALLSVSVLWDALALWTGTTTWWTISYWNLIAGLVTSLPALATGFAEFVALPRDSDTEDLVLWHLGLTGTAVTCFLGSLLVRGDVTAPTGARLVGVLAFSIVGLALLVIGGHLGANLVYEHRLGHADPDDRS